MEKPISTEIAADGWHRDALRCPSPNFGERPPVLVDLLVIHNISLPPGQFGGGYIASFFCNLLNPSDHPYFETICDLKVSAHFLINRRGELLQFVSVHDRAWHAGTSSWQGRENCNDFSVGVELEGTDWSGFTDEQYDRLGNLTKSLMASFPALQPDRIVGHSDIAPGRKTDPGPTFDWNRFRNILAAS